MKKKLQGFAVGFLACLAVTSVVFAKDISEKVDIFYNNIKIYIDGGELVPKDAIGNTVEPFIMNGTTYLPVRAVAQAFGKEVEWDGKTQSVYIGKKGENQPDNYLHKLQYNDLKLRDYDASFSILKSPIKDVDGKEYTNGLLFESGYYDKNRAVDVFYPLNSQYKKLKGNIVLPSGMNTSVTDVGFYGDDNLLYKATGVVYSMPFKFDIDVAGINQLKIVVYTKEEHDFVALTDLALYK